MLRRLDQLLHDARFGLRQLVRSPLVAAVAILTLAIGIGLNTAVFTLVHAVLLRPLPTRTLTGSSGSRRTASAGHRIRRRHAATTWSGSSRRMSSREWPPMAHRISILAGGEASQERVASTGGDFWDITGARPILGRLPADDDEQALVLSFGLFQRRFGGLPTIIGQALEISGAPFTIVGVLPETFRVTFPQQTAPGDELRDIDAFISLPSGQQLPGTFIQSPNRPAPPWIRVVARLAPAIPVSRARLEMETLHARLQRDYPRHPALLRSIHVVPLRDKLTESARSRCWCSRPPSGSCCSSRWRTLPICCRAGVASDEGNSHSRSPRGRSPGRVLQPVPASRRRPGDDRRNDRGGDPSAAARQPAHPSSLRLAAPSRVCLATLF